MTGQPHPSASQPASQPVSGYVQQVQNPFQDAANELAQKQAEEARSRLAREQAAAAKAQQQTSQGR